MHYRSVIPVIAGCLFTANVFAADLMQTYMEALELKDEWKKERKYKEVYIETY